MNNWKLSPWNVPCATVENVPFARNLEPHCLDRLCKPCCVWSRVLPFGGFAITLRLLMEALRSYKTDSDKQPGLTGAHSLPRQKTLPVCCSSSFLGDSYVLCSCTGGRLEAHTWDPADSAQCVFPLTEHALHPWVVISHNHK